MLLFGIMDKSISIDVPEEIWILISKDELLKRVMERIAVEEFRKLLLKYFVAEEATKEDIEGLRKATKEDIESLRKDVEKLEVGLKSYVDARIDDLNRRIDDLYGVMKASLVAIVITLASTILVPLILKIFF